jgi:hypothetical protein
MALFGYKRQEVTGGERGVQNEEVDNFLCSPDKIKVI